MDRTLVTQKLKAMIYLLFEMILTCVMMSRCSRPIVAYHGPSLCASNVCRIADGWCGERRALDASSRSEAAGQIGGVMRSIRSPMGIGTQM